MGPVEIVAIALAGLAAGTINAIVGSGTLITFPTLIAFGIPPRIATMSNAIGQVPGNLAATWGYRRELRGQGKRLLQQLPASVIGALTGAFLLLHLPAKTFETVVPILLVAALVLVVAQPAIQRRVKAHVDRARINRTEAGGAPADEAVSGPAELGRVGLTVLVGATYLIGVYGGYFAAAQGVMLIAVMGAVLPESMLKINATRNVLVTAVNSVAAASYIAVGFNEIVWEASALIAAGTVCGGLIGARVGRRLPAPALRAIIVVLGIVAIWRILAE